MGEARVALTLDGPVAHLVLTRPEVRNAFGGAMLRELRDAFTPPRCATTSA